MKKEAWLKNLSNLKLQRDNPISLNSMQKFFVTHHISSWFTIFEIEMSPLTLVQCKVATEFCEANVPLKLLNDFALSIDRAFKVILCPVCSFVEHVTESTYIWIGCKENVL